MPVFQGDRTVKYINMKQRNADSTPGDPIDISGWEFRATLRRHPNTNESLGELTTANGGFVNVDEVNGRIAMVLDDTLTAALPVGRVHFDVQYSNAPDGPVWVFGGNFMVKQPVTR